MYIFLFFSMICAYNIYRRITCQIKTKITKFTVISNIVFCVMCFASTYFFEKRLGFDNLKTYGLCLMICLSFFTSLISSGISKNGFVQPWNLISKTHKWGNIKEITAEKKEKSIMISFTTPFTQYRQEYNISDGELLKKLIKDCKNINLKKL